MPQMFPMYWLLLIFFYNSYSYHYNIYLFLFFKKPLIELSDYSKFDFNWKW